MNPRKQECLGKYLYGSGYFASEDQQLGILRGERTEAAFCHECPLRRRCEHEHRQTVRATHPEQVEQFEQQVKAGERRGMTRTLVEVARMKAGNPDPFMSLALVNYRQGVEERRAEHDQLD